jgi:hypothetical protein
MNSSETRELYRTLVPGDRVEITHAVKVGFRHWTSVTSGTVVSTSRERHSLHFRRNADDQVYRDTLVLRRDDGELTTVTIDEFTTLAHVDRAG